MSRLTRYENFLLLLKEQSTMVETSFREAVRDINSAISFKKLVQAIERQDLSAIEKILNAEPRVWSAMGSAIRGAFEAGGLQQASHIKAPRRLKNVTGMAVRFDGRHARAETIAKNLGGELIQRVSMSTREAISAAVQEGLAQGRGPRDIAKTIAGALNKSTGERVGGIAGLTRGQALSVMRAKAELADIHAPGALSSYLSRRLRDKRYDALVKKAFKTGTGIPVAEQDRIVRRLASKTLDHRALTIARTETLSALNSGKAEAADQIAGNLGVGPGALRKVWQATPSSKRTRDSHRALNGVSVPIDGVFVSKNGGRMRFPGDRELGAGGAETINCRCSMDTDVDWEAVANAAR